MVGAWIGKGDDANLPVSASRFVQGVHGRSSALASNRLTKIAVTGGRDYRNKARVWQVLDAAVIRLGMTSGIDGGAPGADLHARMWAADNKFPWHTEKAKWHVYRRAAGPIRNQVMIDMRPDIVIAFPGNDGTADMVRQATAAGIRVFRID